MAYKLYFNYFKKLRKKKIQEGNKRKHKIFETLISSKNHKKKNLINWNSSKLKICSSNDTLKEMK